VFCGLSLCTVLPGWWMLLLWALVGFELRIVMDVADMRDR